MLVAAWNSLACLSWCFNVLAHTAFTASASACSGDVPDEQHGLLSELLQCRQLLSDRDNDVHIAAQIGLALVERSHRIQLECNALEVDMEEQTAANAELENLLDSYKLYIEDLRERNVNLAEFRGSRGSGSGNERSSDAATRQSSKTAESVSTATATAGPDPVPEVDKMSKLATLDALETVCTNVIAHCGGGGGSLSDFCLGFAPSQFLHRELDAAFQPNQSVEVNFNLFVRNLRRERKEHQLSQDTLRESLELSVQEKRLLETECHALDAEAAQLRTDNDDLLGQTYHLQEALQSKDLSFSSELKVRRQEDLAAAMALMASLEADERGTRAHLLS